MLVHSLEAAMKRREFVTLIGGAAATWPFAALAQQSMMPVVALIRDGSAGASPRFLGGFRQGVSANGFFGGQEVEVAEHLLGRRKELPPALRGGPGPPPHGGEL